MSPVENELRRDLAGTQRQLDATRTAARAMLTALEQGHDYITSPRKHQTAARADIVQLEMARAICAARDAGITTEQ